VEGSTREVKIAVLEFEDRVRDPALEGLASTAGETMRSGLRAVPGFTVLDASEDEAQATWVVRGTVQRVGDEARLTARVEAARQQIGEPVEVSGAAADPATRLDRLRERTIDEARLLIRDHQRRARAFRETESSAAHGELLADYDLSGEAVVAFVFRFFLARVRAGVVGVAKALATGPPGTTAARHGERGANTPDRRSSG
jgi:hypothetical protein